MSSSPPISPTAKPSVRAHARLRPCTSAAAHRRQCTPRRRPAEVTIGANDGHADVSHLRARAPQREDPKLGDRLLAQLADRPLLRLLAVAEPMRTQPGETPDRRRASSMPGRGPDLFVGNRTKASRGERLPRRSANTNASPPRGRGPARRNSTGPPSTFAGPAGASAAGSSLDDPATSASASTPAATRTTARGHHLRRRRVDPRASLHRPTVPEAGSLAAGARVDSAS